MKKNKSSKSSSSKVKPIQGVSSSRLSDSAHVKYGANNFSLPNGDSYKGEYIATYDRKIFRQGKGHYYTWDNQLYDGSWENDELIGKAQINFPDASYYEGDVSEFTYNGEGRYVLYNGTDINCAFANNRPTMDVVFTDPTGHQWHGLADSDGVILKPVNHYLIVVKNRSDAIEQEKIKLVETPSENSGDQSSESILRVKGGSLKGKVKSSRHVSTVSMRSSSRSRSKTRSSGTDVKTSASEKQTSKKSIKTTKVKN